MDKKRVDTTRLQRIARAYTQSAALYTALDLGLFTHVAAGCDTHAKLAEATDILPLNVERLTTACLALGLLLHEDGRVLNAPDAQRYLVEGSPGYAGAWINFTRPQITDWFELTQYLRRKDPPSVLGMYADLTVEQARGYHAATFSIGMGAGRRFARQVDLSKRSKLLDLGGGSGAYSINAVKTYPGLSAVVFDLPPVIEVTKEYLAEARVADRVSTWAGDFTRDPLPTDCDVIVMASNLPIYDEQVIAAVIARCHGALLPGGEMHLVGEMLFDDRPGPLDAAMWGLSEALTGGAGKAHTIGQCRDYFADAGFIAIAAAEFVPDILQRVSGLKASNR